VPEELAYHLQKRHRDEGEERDADKQYEVRTVNAEGTIKDFPDREGTQ
jgi:hypothetical protein